MRLCDDAREDSPDGRADDLATHFFEGVVMGSLIAARMASTAEMLACFDDTALVDAALWFERELAAALAEHGVIAPDAAAAVARACDGFDSTGLAEAAAHAGTLAIPLVARLRAAVPAEHAGA